MRISVLLFFVTGIQWLSAEDAARTAVKRAIGLIEKSASTYIEERSCFSCHHQALTVMALSQSKLAGFTIRDEVVSAQSKFTLEYFTDRKERLPKGEGVPGGSYSVGYALAGLTAAQEPSNETTHALLQYLIKTQKADGSWRIRTHRPPLENSHFTSTALGLKATAQTNHAKKAAQWLVKTKARSNEDYIYKILGLHWAGMEKETEGAVKALLKLQREDGGWGQTPEMKSDAYATGQALTVLRKSGLIQTHSPQYKRGTEWLLKNQKPDGSWQIKTRSKPIQKYFESGFPHGKDQFISISATCWSVMALLAK
ncbi:MAG: terpene cyclase/mutase family protein [Verrucomicrobiota bacterium]|jgi:squalene cyclase|nr:terpene cyclase/mutase family protein [Verrucomicrobiota bacterium]